MAEQLGIVGSGAIARGLARVAADHHEVVVWARSERSAERARGEVGEARRWSPTWASWRSCTIAVEAVAEDLAIKSERADAASTPSSPDEALVASTTSSLSVAELAAASGRPDRFAGLHVFNPVERMELVELCFPAEATASTRARFRDLCERSRRPWSRCPTRPASW